MNSNLTGKQKFELLVGALSQACERHCQVGIQQDDQYLYRGYTVISAFGPKDDWQMVKFTVDGRYDGSCVHVTLTSQVQLAVEVMFDIEDELDPVRIGPAEDGMFLSTHDMKEQVQFTQFVCHLFENVADIYYQDLRRDSADAPLPNLETVLREWL